MNKTKRILMAERIERAVGEKLKKIERYDNKFGSSGCYKCKQKSAVWKFTLSLSEKYDMNMGKFTVLLCDDCAKLNETQLRIFFLGQGGDG